MSELAQEFDLNPGQIRAWKRNAASPSHAQVRVGVQGAEGDTGVVEELRMLRKQVKELQLENNILKMAAIILETSTANKTGK